MGNSVLLFGGNSGERLVSVASAQNLASHYDFSEIVFLHKTGELSLVSKDELLAHKNAFEVEFMARSKPFSLSLKDSLTFLKGKTVFLALHGTEGEDGKIQALFESAKIGFTGSGAVSSKNSFAKDTSKKIISHFKIPLAPEFVFARKNLLTVDTKLKNFFDEHKKIVIKPTESGSSIGLHIIFDLKSLNEALTAIRGEEYEFYIAEKFIEGRELTVGVFNNSQGLSSLSPSEIILQEGHSFDYQGKYLGRGTIEVTPAKLSPSEIEMAQKLAKDAHLAFGCYGYSRTDMILTKNGPLFLETNTLPGLSKASFVPQQLAYAKIPMKEFIEGQLTLAENRYT